MVVRDLTIIEFWGVSLVKQGIELISSDIVRNAHLIQDRLDIQSTTYNQNSWLRTVLLKVRSNWAIIHKHMSRIKELLPKSIVHLLDFARLETTTTIRQTCKRD